MLHLIGAGMSPLPPEADMNTTPLKHLLATYRQTAHSEREKGTYFEELVRAYFRYEASYADLYSQVWLYADWAKEQGLDARDTGIDLVAKTAGTAEYHAIQCKFYDEEYRIQKKDIDSFFTASGQQPFTHRIIVSTTANWSENAELALVGQQPPVTKIDLHDLENSQIDWARYAPSQPPPLKPKYSLRPHQTRALHAVKAGLATADRGKLIMACGTGKTFVSLKIAEEMAGKGGRVLFLVPSLNLLSQTLTEWTQQSATPLHSFAVCSDAEVGKKRRRSDEDVVETLAHELRYPATTDAASLAAEVAKRHDAHHLGVVFSTYHSIEVISRAQHLHGLPGFDLIVCDEAHRTTGATFDDESESNFVKVHNADFIRAAKRLYMTATPRIYADVAKATAERDSVALCSMDDPALYGDLLHIITFSEAVQFGLLSDYKVIVLTIDETHVSSRLQELLADDNNQLKVDDAARIVGCWKALSKQGIQDELEDGEPMRRAVAFCQVIEPGTGRGHKVSSKQIAAMFRQVVEAYQAQEELDHPLVCEVDHVDGTMNATEKEAKLDWLKSGSAAGACRILSNVRCLSEGVDVPALDAVLFLTPRSSQVDVVQSVGRVMRNAPGKRRGYVVLPVVIPAGMQPHEALNDNQVYKVVWEVLQALRSHDDRFDAMINKLDLIGRDPRKMEVVAICDSVQRRSKSAACTDGAGRDQFTLGADLETREDLEPYQPELQFNIGELERAIYAKVVKKCGNRNYWDEWAGDIAKIANTHIARIAAIVENPANPREAAAFKAFAGELRDDLNDSITDPEVIEMLAQHLITKPVFDALFANYSFASHNPVSKAMQNVLDTLHEHHLEKETDTLDKFYASVKMRAAGIDSAEGKQKIVVELYDKFFRNAFPRMTERLGIVYTPVEVVDFIIRSVDDLLQSEFNQTLGSEGVHILDPFTGTGTFVTRLLQSGLIPPERLPHKYQHEIHANEIVLLAYYIAAINIEAVYHGLMEGYGEAMGYGVRGMGCGKAMGDGVWGVGGGVLGVSGRANEREERHGEDAIVQGLDRLAGSDEHGGAGLCQDNGISQRGDLRSDQPGTPGGNLDSSQHRGGLRTAEPEGIPAISVNCQRLADRAGNASADSATGGTPGCPDHAALAGSTDLCGQTPDRPAQIPLLERGMGDRVWGMGEVNGIRYASDPPPHPTPHTPHPTPYTPFQGICLTDTFQLYEKDDLISRLLVDNSDRRNRQKALDIRVIIGNPPYSAGQESANDNNQNVAYPELDASIRRTYAKYSKMTSVKNLYDSYIRAIRWASDRIGDAGIVGFVTNAGFLDANTADGLRKCLAEEFSSIYIFHLRGNARTSGEVRRKEKDNVFGQGTRTPIAISMLVKNPAAPQPGQIFWHDIGDYLTREQKLAIVRDFRSLAGLTAANAWIPITPDAHHDWINQRNSSFDQFIKIGDKKVKASVVVFENYSLGLGTNRDAWCYNSSKALLAQNMRATIDFYNAEVERHIAESPADLNAFVNTDPTRIGWSSSLLPKVERHLRGEFSDAKLVIGTYRPFQKQWVYFDGMFNHRVGQMPQLFPQPGMANRVIQVNSKYQGHGQVALISDALPDLHCNGDSQCFPLHLYEKATPLPADDLFADSANHTPHPTPHTPSPYTRKDGISDAGLAHFRKAYPGETFTKEDLFYYIYGLLHSPDYRERYADNLTKELPRIPAVKSFADFQAFSQAGRELADLHLNYETVDKYPVTLDPGNLPLAELTATDYQVVKMRFAKTRDADGKSIPDKTTVLYNPRLTIRDIPLAAYDYIVNGKPALEWVIERQSVTTDKDSGIVNDANLYASETLQNPQYPLELFQRIITVSLKTMEIVNTLPGLEIG